MYSKEGLSPELEEEFYAGDQFLSGQQTEEDYSIHGVRKISTPITRIDIMQRDKYRFSNKNTIKGTQLAKVTIKSKKCWKR